VVQRYDANNDRKRLDGRGTEDVRNLEMEIDIYNTAWFFFILQG
jgi:exosome complex RNA-binding protein Rrp42 (RNase PH superfamily)